MKVSFANPKQVIGTSFKGYLHINYETLRMTFGCPYEKPSIDNKIHTQWSLSFPSRRVISTIYNWKNGPNYPKGKPIEDITTWHIGGKNMKSVYVVYEYLRENKVFCEIQLDCWPSTSKQGKVINVHN